MIPLITRRSLTRCAPRRPRGINGPIRFHSASLSQYNYLRIKASLDSETLNHNSDRAGILIEYGP